MVSQMDDSFLGFLDDSDFGDANFAGDDLFALLQSLERITDVPPVTPTDQGACLTSQKPRTTTSTCALRQETPTTTAEAAETSPKSKRQKLVTSPAVAEEGNLDGQHRMSHITVERNRRKQMNDHLSVLRSFMPCFYVKRGDQASIIGGVVDYIKELQQILQSLEAKKQRKAVYSEVLSPRLVSSPIPSTLSPRKPPLSPRLNLPPISPRTPTPGSPYKPRQGQQVTGYGGHSPSPTSSSSASSSVDNANELVANSKSAVAEVEVKSCGANVVLKTVSPRIPGQAVRIIAALEELALEILQVSVSTVDEKLLNSFTIKIGIECQLSAEELANQVQQTFCQLPSL